MTGSYSFRLGVFWLVAPSYLPVSYSYYSYYTRGSVPTPDYSIRLIVDPTTVHLIAALSLDIV